MADGRIEIDTRIDDSGLQSGLKNIQSSLKGASKKMKETGTTLSTYVTAPIVGLGTAALWAGANFEEGMSKVAAISGATESDLKLLTEQAKDLGATTKFSATEASEGMAFLAMAGFKTKDILAAMPGLLDLAAAGAMDLGAAADIASNIMSGFGIEAGKAGHVADVLAKASSSANTDVAQLGEAMKYIAPSAKVLGWDVEQSTAAVMAFSDAGIQGGQAGAAFASSLTRLSNPTKEMQGVMDDLGLSFFDAEGNMKSMPDVIAMMESKMGGLTAEQKAAALSTIFGAEAFKHWAVLLDKGSDQLGKNTEMLRGADGAAKEMAQTMADNAKGDLKTFMSALEGVGIQIYDILQPAIRAAIQFITEMTRKFSELSPQAKIVVLVIAGIVAAIGPLLLIAGFLASAISALAGAFALVSGPVLAIVAVVAVFVAALIAAYARSETFRNKVNAVFASIKKIALEVFAAVASFIKEKIAQIQAFWDQYGTQILQAVQNVFNGIKAVIDFIMPAILFVVKFVWDSIKGVINGALNIIMGVVKIFTGIFTLDWKLMWDGIVQLLFGAIEFILNLMNLTFIGGIKKAFVTLIKNGWKNIKKFSDDIIKGFKSMYDNSLKTVNNMVAGVVKWFANLGTQTMARFNSIKTFTGSIWTGIKETIKNLVLDAVNLVKARFQNMKDNAVSIFNGIKSVATSIFNAVKSAITNPIETAKKTAISVFNAIKKAMVDPIEAAKSTIKKAIEAIKGFFKNMKVAIPMPHFNVSMGTKKIKGVSVPWPDVGVSWYAKGAVFPAGVPQLIGIGDNKRHQEAALPLSPSVLGMIGSKIADEMPIPESTGSGNIMPDSMQAKISIGGYEAMGLVEFITKQQSTNKRTALRGLRGSTT